VLPDPVYILDEDGNRKNSFVGPYREQDNFSLLCRAVGGGSHVLSLNILINFYQNIFHISLPFYYK
jgi:hypothetical protein